jgi:rare lipoprotein A
MAHSAVLLALMLACTATAAVAAPGISGLSSWYGPRFEGHRTASGCVFKASGLTAASRTIPIGAWVRVRNHHNRRSVVVQITDRGPFVRGRILDLSRGAAERLDMIAAGVAMMDLEVLPRHRCDAVNLQAVPDRVANWQRRGLAGEPLESCRSLADPVVRCG